MTTSIDTIVSSTAKATREAGFGAAIISKIAANTRKNLEGITDAHGVVTAIAKACKQAGLDRTATMALLSNLKI